MKIGIFSQDETLYSTRRLIEAAKAHGHEVQVVDPLKCYMNITSSKPTVHYAHKEVKQELFFDAIIPRIGPSITSYGIAVLRQFEVAGTYSVNESVAIARSRDKLRAHQLLARKCVGMPRTCYANSPEVTEDLIKFVGGPPLVVKVIESTHGEGVVLAETQKAAESLIEAFRGLRANFLVQEFVKESHGTDIRCFVIGKKVVAAMQRIAMDDDFRSNLHRGGKAEAVKLTPQERSIAVKAARVMGLNVAGVDIVRSHKGPLVLEVNSSPGLEGIEKTSEKDLAGLIIEFMEKDVLHGSNKTKGKG